MNFPIYESQQRTVEETKNNSGNHGNYDSSHVCADKFSNSKAYLRSSFIHFNLNPEACYYIEADWQSDWPG